MVFFVENKRFSIEKPKSESQNPAQKPDRFFLESSLIRTFSLHNFTMSTEFCMSCRMKSNESLLTDGLCENCQSQISRESSRISQTNIHCSQKSKSSSKYVSKSSPKSSPKSTTKSAPKINKSFSSESHKLQSTSKSAPTSKTSTFTFVENHQPEKYQTAQVSSTTPSRTSLNECSSVASLNLAIGGVPDYRRRES